MTLMRVTEQCGSLVRKTGTYRTCGCMILLSVSKMCLSFVLQPGTAAMDYLCLSVYLRFPLLLVFVYTFSSHGKLRCAHFGHVLRLSLTFYSSCGLSTFLCFHEKSGSVGYKKEANFQQRVIWSYFGFKFIHSFRECCIARHESYRRLIFSTEVYQASVRRIKLVRSLR